jgi:hypothetical protein
MHSTLRYEEGGGRQRIKKGGKKERKREGGRIETVQGPPRSC